ncbi:hypothetical protein F4780DRAFT_763789 [Xylariomycetidae sp. FL0641]|nr:hypothetical protein F4780DRAFT_763789 [Xylariomycetidae sp. FL0641]
MGKLRRRHRSTFVLAVAPFWTLLPCRALPILAPSRLPSPSVRLARPMPVFSSARSSSTARIQIHICWTCPSRGHLHVPDPVGLLRLVTCSSLYVHPA